MTFCLVVTQYSVLSMEVFTVQFLVSAFVKGDLEIRRTCGFNWHHSCHVRDDVNQAHASHVGTSRDGTQKIFEVARGWEQLYGF
jgi:hypothetical protein